MGRIGKSSGIKEFVPSLKTLSTHTRVLRSKYLLLSSIDKGETEAIFLYKELNADFLLIDDKKARLIAEAHDITCVGTLGLLFLGKQKQYIDNLRSEFEKLIVNRRYYSKELLNYFLEKTGEALFN